MILPILGLLAGLAIGFLAPVNIPLAYAKLFSVALLAALDQGLGVGDTHGFSQEDRGVEVLADLEGLLHHGMGLGGVGGLEHGDAGEGGVIAAVLLVLGGVDGGVVCRQDDQAAVDAGVADAHQRVCRHVDTHVLHRD